MKINNKSLYTKLSESRIGENSSITYEFFFKNCSDSLDKFKSNVISKLSSDEKKQTMKELFKASSVLRRYIEDQSLVAINWENIAKTIYHQAAITIKAITQEFQDQGQILANLPNIVTKNINTYISNYFNKHSSLIPYDNHKAALAEAIVRKYYEDKLKTATNNRSGLKRALNNMSDQDKDFAKSWFKEHVTDIYFIVPKLDEDDYSNETITVVGTDGLVDIDATNKIAEKLQRIAASFDETYPNAIHGEDYTFRYTSNTPDPRQVKFKDARGRKNKDIKVDDKRKDLWSLMAFVTFDTKVSEMPDQIKAIIENAKSQAKQETKTMQAIADSYTVSSVPLAQVILKLFNNDFNFYKQNRGNNSSSVNNGLDLIIDEYSEK